MNPARRGGDLSLHISGGAGDLVACHATPQVTVSTPNESLIFFILRLMERLREIGTAPAADFTEHGRSLRSFRKVTIARRTKTGYAAAFSDDLSS